MIPPKTLKHDPNDDWAEVELYRWQYGELPPPNDNRPLNIPTALKNMANAIEKRDMKNFPSPLGVTSVLRYVAKRVKN